MNVLLWKKTHIRKSVIVPMSPFEEKHIDMLLNTGMAWPRCLSFLCSTVLMDGLWDNGPLGKTNRLKDSLWSWLNVLLLSVVASQFLWSLCVSCVILWLFSGFVYCIFSLTVQLLFICFWSFNANSCFVHFVSHCGFFACLFCNFVTLW